MAKDINQFKYVLPVGTVLKSKYGAEGKERSYIIEQVVNGKPLRKGQKVKVGDDVKPVLGQGGFGITYLASRKIKDGNIDLGTAYYAIKEFFVKSSCYREKGSMLMQYSPAAEKDIKESLRDFKEEAIRLKEICKGNPNIVNVNEVFEANGTAYYVMEFLEGESLRSLVKRTGPLSEDVALSLIRPIAEAVDYIHTQHRLLHLDIKPDNIMLRKSSDGQQTDPVLIDFGVSVHFNKKGELTTTHTSVGVSEGYSPQEQYGGVAKIVADRKRAQDDGFKNISLMPCEVDIYALGATLYYILVGTNPYGAFSMTTEIVRAKLPQTLSNKTRQVVIDAMQPMSSNRTQTAADFLKGFEDRYTLPKGFVLHSPLANYLITGIEKETDYCIQYGAVIYSGGSESLSGNTTKTQRYVVFERFNKKMYSRMKDESVKADEATHYWQKEKEEYFKACAEHTGLQEIGENEIIGGILVREIFNGNGTTYAVVKQGWKPLSPIVRLIVGIGRHFNKNKKHYGIGVVSMALVALLGYGIHYGVSAYTKNKEAEREKQQKLSAMLTSAIEHNDSIALLKFANSDSARAYMPLANIYLNANDIAKARMYAEFALKDDDGNQIAKKMLADLNPPTTAKESKPAPKEVEGAQTSPGDKDKAQVAIDEQKIEEKRKKQEAEKKKQEQEELAKKNEQAEAAKKALQYVNGERTYENHQKAYQWALKADPATRAKVIQRLKDMDFPIP